MLNYRSKSIDLESTLSGAWLLKPGINQALRLHSYRIDDRSISSYRILLGYLILVGIIGFF